MKQFSVQQNEAGQRLDKLLGKLLNKAPKSFIYKMLRKKNITLNGKKADGSEKLVLADEITFFLSDDTFNQFHESNATQEIPSELDLNLDIIYEDKHIIIVNKPVGVLSQKAEKNDISMVEYIIAYLIKTGQITQTQLESFQPAVCNRLDRNTGGILIAGKSLAGLQEMSRLLKSRALSKYYLCIVKGKVEDKKTIEGFLSKDYVKNQVNIYPVEREDTEYICTEYEPIDFTETLQAWGSYSDKTTRLNNFKGDYKFKEKSILDISTEVNGIRGSFTLLQVKLITGRSHQIRAHLASIGHPIIGDYKYGDQKTNHYFNKKYSLSYQLLHSYRMIFPELNGEFAYLSHKEFTAGPPELFMKIKNDLFR